MKTKWEPCAVGCPGWAVFNDNQIQRCDECNRFENDEQAIGYVRSFEVLDTSGFKKLELDDLLAHVRQKIKDADLDIYALADVTSKLLRLYIDTSKRMDRKG